MAGGKNDFSIEEAYRKTIEELTKSGKKITGAAYLVLKDKIGNKYLIARINQQDCVKDGHLVFLACYPTNDIPGDGSETFGVMMSLDIYAGMEVHIRLPQDMYSKYHPKAKTTVVGFE